MTDKALENAKAKRDQLLNAKKEVQAKLKALDAQLEAVQRFIADYQLFSAAEPDSIVNLSLTESTGGKAGTGVHGGGGRTNSPKERVAAMAREIITERGKPISRTELLGELRRRGLTIEGKSPATVLSTMLWRMKDEVKVAFLPRAHGYWTLDKKWPPAGYFPDHDLIVDISDLKKKSDKEPSHPDEIFL